MGYGIRFHILDDRRITREQVRACVLAIQEIIKKHPKVVQVEFKDKLSLNNYNINFNGVGKKNQHETFIFYSSFKENIAEEIVDALDEKHQKYREVITANGYLEMCEVKTARKKYDKIVKEVLMKCQEITNDAFDIICDDGFKYTKNGIVVRQGAVDYIEKGRKIITYKTLDEISKLKKYDWSKKNAKL